METQISLNENNLPIETTSQLIDVTALLDELRQTDFQITSTQATLDTLTAKRDALATKLNTVQQLPDIEPTILSKIQELPEFAPVEITPVNETKI